MAVRAVALDFSTGLQSIVGNENLTGGMLGTSIPSTGAWRIRLAQHKREYVQKMIVAILLQMKPNAPTGVVQKLPSMSRRIEESLLLMAQNEDEYLNESTLKNRIIDLQQTHASKFLKRPSPRSIQRQTRLTDDQRKRFFIYLQAWRNKTIQDEGVGPWDIMPTHLLAQVASIVPKNLQELEQLCGVEPKWIGKYGASLMDHIGNCLIHLDTKGTSTTRSSTVRYNELEPSEKRQRVSKASNPSSSRVTPIAPAKTQKQAVAAPSSSPVYGSVSQHASSFGIPNGSSTSNMAETESATFALQSFLKNQTPKSVNGVPPNLLPRYSDPSSGEVYDDELNHVRTLLQQSHHENMQLKAEIQYLRQQLHQQQANDAAAACEALVACQTANVRSKQKRVPAQVMTTLTLIHGVTLMEERFLYRRQIGAGTSSIVVLAYDTKTQKSVAIKIWEKALNMAGEREVDILELIADKRPSVGLPIVQLYGSFYFKERLCIVMEHLESPVSLRHVPSNPKTLISAIHAVKDIDTKCHVESKIPRNKLRQMIFDACAALLFIHKLGIIHGDLKPDNLLYDSSVLDGNVKLIDFGNSIYKHEAIQLAKTHEFDVQTMMYRAPEVAIGASLTCAADMWSLGCIVLEGVLGHPVFVASSRSKLLIEIDQLFPMTLKRGIYFEEYIRERYACDVKPLSLELLFKQFDIPVERDLLSFLHGCFTIDPERRMTAAQAVLHPFLLPMHPLSFIYTLREKRTMEPHPKQDDSRKRHQLNAAIQMTKRSASL